ncbi:hypothetical protein MLD38_038145 [Melastoma candidum]|uniref:Uncharacterized protein n=1 Tax=Melastoma candidum TaxID=119954 RepID=A0ACB9KY20_9MYRT|nr:hypothetical protein MLD38_038145 [Melastoma candidum]
MGSLSDAQSDGDSDISESEMDDHEKKCYMELKKGKRPVLVKTAGFTCPYCPKKRKREYLYAELLQHAAGVGKSTSDKRSAKEKANHLALMRFLEKDLAHAAETSRTASDGNAPKRVKEDHADENNKGAGDFDTIVLEVKAYDELKSGKLRVKVSDVAYACPFCPNMKKNDYAHIELLQHASGVGKSSSEKRSVLEKANHLALTKYLEKDLPNAVGPSKTGNEENSPSGESHGGKYVWPWTGIVVNIPTRRAPDGRVVGESGSKLRDEYKQRGFNPKRVHPLWTFRGHSGCAVVEFGKDWPCLRNALAFEQAYEADHHGRKDWTANDEVKTGLYAWVARAEDYFSTGIVAEHLHKIGDVRTISEIEEEEARKHDKLENDLKNIIEVKNKYMQEMAVRCDETSNSLNVLIEEKDKLLQSYNEELKKMQSSSHDHFQRIFSDHEKQKLQLESHKKALELRGQELEQREAKNEVDRKMLSEEIEKNALMNSSLRLASLEQQKADDNVLKLAEEQKKQQEALHNRIIQLERQLDAKQALEMEIEQLRGTLNVMKHMEDDDDAEVLQKIEGMLKDLREKEEEYDHLQDLSQNLIIKERKINDEVQEARKELISALKNLASDSGQTSIGVRRMGELDTEPFLEAMKIKYNNEEAEDRASELCSLWDEYLRDTNWHPFKNIEQSNGTYRRMINEEDERLRDLKNELGDKVYKAVTNALTEINECNPSGGYITVELWNYEEKRKASLKEGLEYLLKIWNLHMP